MTIPGMNTLTKSQAIHLFGSIKELQSALGLKTHSAISMWSNVGPIPDVHYLRIRHQLRPEAFDAAGNLLPEFEKAAAQVADHSQKAA
jgi:hypothetical protein